MNATACDNRLQELESVIEGGWRKSGEALMAIRDERLWRSDYRSWAEYCEKRWGYTKQHCNRLIAGSEAVRQVEHQCSTPVRQDAGLALAALEPEVRAEVAQAASLQAESEDRPLTASDIHEASAPRECKPANVLAVETAQASEVKAQSTQAVDEMQVAIEDLKIVIDKLSDFEVEPETLEACAEELAKTARMLKRLAKLVK